MSVTTDPLVEWMARRLGTTEAATVIYRQPGDSSPIFEQAQDVAAEFAETLWAGSIKRGETLKAVLFVEVKRKGDREAFPFAMTWQVKARIISQPEVMLDSP